jgi:hypothetical protein
MGCFSPDVPEPTEQEQQIQNIQLQQYQQGQELQKQLMPFQLENMGLIRDKKTKKLREMTEEEKLAGMSESERQQYDISRLQQNRLEAALGGTLPVDPAMEENLKNEEGKLREYLSQTLGPEYEQSTAGIQALSKFQTQAESLRYSARRGEMDVASSGLLSNLGYLGNYNTQQWQQATQTPMGYGQYSGMGTGLLTPYMQQRQMQVQSGIAEGQAWGGLMKGVGELGGTALLGGTKPWTF